MAHPLRSPALAAAALLAVAACADRAPLTSSPLQPSARPRADVTATGGQYVIGVRPGTEPDAAAIAASGGTVTNAVPKLGIYVVSNVADPAPLVASGAQFVERDYAITLDAQQLPQADPEPGTAVAVTGGPDASWITSGMQWDLKAMKADQTIAAGARGAGVNVCIIDSGLDDSHQELSGKVDKLASFVANSLANMDSSGHGTHVAGSIGAKGLVMSGVAPDARLFGAKVFNASGSSSSIVPFLNAITWCTDQGAHVINMSLGGIRFLAGTPATSTPDYQAYLSAISYATNAGVVVVTSAGNSNLRMPNPAQLVVPAQVAGTIIVGATGPASRNVPALRPNGQIATIPRNIPASWNPFDAAQVVASPDAKAYYSNFGTGVDVFAPGGRQGFSLTFLQRITTETVVDSITMLPVVPARTARVQHGTIYDGIWSTCSRFSTFTGGQDVGGRPGTTTSCRTANQTDRYTALQGTSMAAPHVAGLAAVLYEALGGARSAANRAKVESCIKTGTDNIGPSTTFGNGRVNAVKALACARS